MNQKNTHNSPSNNKINGVSLLKKFKFPKGKRITKKSELTSSKKPALTLIRLVCKFGN